MSATAKYLALMYAIGIYDNINERLQRAYEARPIHIKVFDFLIREPLNWAVAWWRTRQFIRSFK